jgi:peroxiredoxin Q/BCP
MKQLIIGLALSALFAAPAFAALKVGDTAPDFTAAGSLGGKDFTFSLKSALKNGPVVVYFYPSAYTGGCDLEAHTFAEQSGKFAGAGATIVGVSADDLGRLKKFSADPAFCAGKFPIVSDADTKIAQSYALNVTPPRDGAMDVNKDAIGHAFIERFTYVIGKDGKILATLSSKTDSLSPDQHVDKSLAIVTASK